MGGIRSRGGAIDGPTALAPGTTEAPGQGQVLPETGYETHPSSGGAPSPRSAHPGFSRRRFVVGAGVVAAVVVVFAIWMAVGFGGPVVVDRLDDLAEFGAALIAAVSCLLVERHRETRARLAWHWIGASALAWAIGEGIWSVYDIGLGVKVPFPSFADVGFLAAVPLAVIGIGLFPAAPTRTVSRLRTLLDGLLLAGSLLFLSWATALGSVYKSSSGGPLKEVIALAYPLSDVLIATVVLHVLVRTRPGARVRLGMLAVGLLCLAAADSSFAYFTSSNSFGSGNVVDTGWVLGYLVIALAPWWPAPGRTTRRRSEEGLSRAQLLVPYAIFAIAVLTALEQEIVHRRLEPFLVVDGLVLIAVILIRQILTLSENAALTRSLERAVRDLRDKETSLSHQALHDPLTGLANRLLFAERLELALASSRRSEREVALLFLDLDEFKYVNDSFGHATGDRVLVEISERLVSCVRPDDTVARLGGDEFAVVLAGIADLEEADHIAGRIVETMHKPITLAGGSFRPRVSIGIATSTMAPSGAPVMLHDADVALYVAKAVGGSAIRTYDAEIGEAHRDQLAIEADLAVGLDEGRFFLEYQPVLELKSGEPVGLEALVRWRRPGRGVLRGSDFLDVAEASGHIRNIGRFALFQALGDLAELERIVPLAGQLWVSVKVSTRQLEVGVIDEDLDEVLRSSGIAPGRVHLEITERSIVDQSAEALDVLRSIASLGCQLEVDDFATGYSSLTSLQRLPVELLKLDRSVVAELCRSDGDQMIVQAIIQLGHALGVAVVAEGVETTEQLEQLRSFGCEYGQGLFWGGTIRADDLPAWLGASDQSRQSEVVAGSR